MKHTLLSTVAAIVLLSSGAAFAGGHHGPVNTGNVALDVDLNAAVAIQQLDSEITQDNVMVNGGSETGDIDNNFKGSGVYTVQGQTGLNNSGTNGANIAAQSVKGESLDYYASPDIGSDNFDLNAGVNASVAYQELDSSVTNSTVTVMPAMQMGPFGQGKASETGDIYVAQSGGPSVMTVQNQTGYNNAGTNGLNMAASVVK